MNGGEVVDVVPVSTGELLAGIGGMLGAIVVVGLLVWVLLRWRRHFE